MAIAGTGGKFKLGQLELAQAPSCRQAFQKFGLYSDWLLANNRGSGSSPVCIESIISAAS